jgi:hypothetical protein
MTEMVKWIFSAGTGLSATRFRVVDGEDEIETTLPTGSSDSPAGVLLCRLIETRQIASFDVGVVLMFAAAPVQD